MIEVIGWVLVVLGVSVLLGVGIGKFMEGPK